MCQKKPGPRCYSHLSTEVQELDTRVAKQVTKLESLQENASELTVKINYAKTKEDRVALVEEHNRVFEEVLAVQKDLTVSKVKKRDAEKRILGTATGQKLAAKRLEELQKEGKPSFVIERYRQEAANARAEHEKNLEYAKWAKKVENGEIPGRFVESAGTQYTQNLHYSDDPMYQATREEVAQLSDEDLDSALKSRYGAYAITPATKEKIFDEKREREYLRRQGNPHVLEKRHASLKSKHPEEYKSVVETKYGDNYLHLDATHPMHSSTLFLVSSEIRNSFPYRTTKDKQIPRAEVLSRAVAKGGEKKAGKKALILDDGSEVYVSPAVHDALRIDGANATGMIPSKE